MPRNSAEDLADIFVNYCSGDHDSIRLKARIPQSVDQPYLDPKTNELNTALLGSVLDKERPHDILQALYGVATSIEGGEQQHG